MPDGLRARLLGAWRLLDVVEEPLDGSPAGRPHGEQPRGLILYSPDGCMSVQIEERERQPVAGADWTALTTEEYAAEARSYFAYAGRFSVDEAAGTVTHHVELSLFPGWAGLSMPRAVELDGDRLVLSSTSPMESGGRQVIVRLSWARA